jgi:hypothetical protein
MCGVTLRLCDPLFEVRLKHPHEPRGGMPENHHICIFNVNFLLDLWR